MDDLNLIPDPNDERVWDNLRRIMEWASRQTAETSLVSTFLLMGA